MLIGIGALGLLLWEPHLEGRNAHATPFEIYFKDPFLAYAYVASISFFIALYQAFKAVGYSGQNKAAAARALRTIKFCAMALIGFVAVGEIFILSSNTLEPGGLFIGLLITLGAIGIGAAATRLERRLNPARKSNA